MEVGHHQGMMTNEHITVGRNSYEKVKTFKTLLTNQNSIQEVIKCRLRVGNSCYYSVQTLFASHLLSENLKIKIYEIGKYCQLCYMVVKHGLLH